MNAKLWTEKQGVTLVELAVAAGIFAIAFVFLLGGLIEMNQTNAVSENQAVCSAYLESVTEEIQGLTYDQLLVYQAPALPGLGADSAIVVEAFRTATIKVRLPVDPATFTGTFPNPIPIQVRAVWIDQQGRANTTSVTTFHRR